MFLDILEIKVENKTKMFKENCFKMWSQKFIGSNCSQKSLKSNPWSNQSNQWPYQSNQSICGLICLVSDQRSAVSVIGQC